MDNPSNEQVELLLKQLQLMQSMVSDMHERLEQQEERHHAERRELLDRILSAENPAAAAATARIQATAKAIERQTVKYPDKQPAPSTHFPRDLNTVIANMGVKPEVPHGD